LNCTPAAGSVVLALTGLVLLTVEPEAGEVTVTASPWPRAFPPGNCARAGQARLKSDSRTARLARRPSFIMERSPLSGITQMTAILAAGFAAFVFAA
jgi:hypothetical protein